MKIILFAPLIFLFVFGSSLLAKSPSPQIFKDEANGLIFQYPAGWKKKTEGQRIFIESPDKNVKIYYIVREREAGKSAYFQLESFFAEIGTANEWNQKKSEVSKEQLALWNAQDGTLGYGTRMAGEETRYYAALALKRNGCFIIEARLLKKYDSKYKNMIFNIFQSLRFLK